MNKLLLSLLWLCALPAASMILTEKEVVNLAIKNFPEILIQHENIIQAAEKLHASRGVFDAVIDGQINSVPVGGYQNNYFEARLNNPIENTANTFSAGYRLGRGDWPVYYQDYLTNTYGDTFIGIDIPLLRNKLIDSNRLAIWQNQLFTEAEKLLLTIKRNEIITLAINAYLEWLKANYRVKIAKRLLDIAIVRQKAIDKQAHLGDIARIDQVENHRLIMQRQSVLVSERQKYLNAKNQLYFYISSRALNHQLPHWQAPNIFHNSIGLQNNQRRLAKIIKYQPYLQYLKTKIRQSQLAIDQSQNEMKAKLDLNLFVDKQHGKGNPRLADTSINLGFKYQLPLRLRKAEGQLAQNQSLIRSYYLQRRLFLRKLDLTFKKIMVDLKSLAEIHYYRSKEINYAEKLEDAERKKFAAGDSSLFLVNQREQTVASTRFLVVDAMIEYKQRLNLLNSICFYNKMCKAILK